MAAHEPRRAAQPAGDDRPSWLSGRPGAWELALHVQPGARTTETQGIHDDCLKLRIAAPPIEGRANDALVRWLAERLEVPQRAVTVVAGQSGRRKRVRVDAALGPDALRRALTGA